MARRSKLASLSFEDIQREITGRRRRIDSLVRKHRRLMAQARLLQAQIEELGGSTSAELSQRGGKRHKNESSLAEALAKVLDGKTLSVTEAAEAVQRAGYRTTSKSFRVQVNILLAKDGRFKRVERGMYTAKR